MPESSVLNLVLFNILYNHTKTIVFVDRSAVSYSSYNSNHNTDHTTYFVRIGTQYNSMSQIKKISFDTHYYDLKSSINYNLIHFLCGLDPVLFIRFHQHNKPKPLALITT